MNTEIRNWPHFVMEMVSILLLICCFIPVLHIGQFAGAEISVHFDAAGRPNRMGDAKELLIVPVMALFTFAVLTLAEKFPKLINAPKKLSETGKEWLTANGWKYARELKLCLMALMCYISWGLYNVATGKAAELPLWGFTLFMAAVLTATIRFYYLLYNHN